MATFREIAARSVSNLFSLYFLYLEYLFISRFGFKSGICLLIAPVPVHCFSITHYIFSRLTVNLSVCNFNNKVFLIFVSQEFGSDCPSSRSLSDFFIKYSICFTDKVVQNLKSKIILNAKKLAPLSNSIFFLFKSDYYKF